MIGVPAHLYRHSTFSHSGPLSSGRLGWLWPRHLSRSPFIALAVIAALTAFDALLLFFGLLQFRRKAVS